MKHWSEITPEELSADGEGDAIIASALGWEEFSKDLTWGSLHGARDQVPCFTTNFSDAAVLLEDFTAFSLIQMESGCNQAELGDVEMAQSWESLAHAVCIGWLTWKQWELEEE